MKCASIRSLAVGLVLSMTGCHHETPPDPNKAEAVGARAPAAQLTTVDNKQVAYADDDGAHANTDVVLYRGYF